MSDPMTPEEADAIVNGSGGTDNGGDVQPEMIEPTKWDLLNGGGVGTKTDPKDGPGGKGDPPPKFKPTPYNPGGDGNGGGGGGGYSPPSPAQQAEFDYKMALASTYMRLWGKNIPAATLNMAVSNGMNVYEFEDWIRRQPGFKHTEVYQDEYADKVLSTARALGVLP